MATELICSNINYKDSSSIFAKLLLPSYYGNIIYNQFVQLNEQLYSTINNFNYIEFYFLTPNGEPYDFNNLDYSFTIEIYEKI